MAKNWLPLLLNAFLASPPEQRGHIRAAISAYACTCDGATLGPMYRTAITKLLKVCLCRGTHSCHCGCCSSARWHPSVLQCLLLVLAYSCLATKP